MALTYPTNDFNDFFGPNSRVGHIGAGKMLVPETYVNLDEDGNSLGPTNLQTPENITDYTQEEVDSINDQARQAGVTSGYLFNSDQASKFLGAQASSGSSVLSIGNLTSAVQQVSGIASSLGFSQVSQFLSIGLNALQSFSSLLSSLSRAPRYSEVFMQQTFGSGIASELIQKGLSKDGTVRNELIPEGHPLRTRYTNVGIKKENETPRTWEEAYHFVSNHIVDGYNAFPTPPPKVTGALSQ